MAAGQAPCLGARSECDAEPRMWNLSLMAISGLCAALLTPVAWLLVRLSGLLSPLVRLLVLDLQLWPLHLVAGLFGCLVGWILLSLLHRVSGTAGRVMILAGGFAGATVSSALFFPLVALF